MKIGIGLGCEEDDERAAASAARAAKRSVGKADLALAFGSIHLDQEAVHRGLCSELEAAVLTGGSSFAEMTDAGVSKGSVAVLLLSLEGAQVRFAQARTGPDSFQTGLSLAEGLGAAPSGPQRLPVGLVFSSIAAGKEQDMLRALSERVGRLPFFGGLCCGDYDLGMNHPDFWTNYQYCGGRLERHGARAVLLDLPAEGYQAAFGFGHGWGAVGPEVEITRAEGAQVYEVEGTPVFDYYRQFLGQDASDDFFDLMIQRFGFSLPVGGEGRTVVKLPVARDFKNGNITYFPAEELQGRKVQLIQASRRGLLEGAREAARNCLKTLGGEKPDLVLAVSCCGRAGILHSRTGDELAALKSVFGSVPVFGYYSGGEIGPRQSRYADAADPAKEPNGAGYHVTTLCLLALRGPKATRPPAAPVPAVECPLPPEQEAARLKALLSKSETILDDTEAFLSNLSRKSYQDAERLRKQNEVIHRYTPHEVWDRVGASVAKGEYELPDSEFNGCFLFMDVKGFTAFSEEHKPGEVVEALNRIFEPATRIIYDCGGDVDKYIGDCIFAAFRKGEDALEAGRRLLAFFKGLQNQPFSVRIGINSGRAVRANVGAKDRREYTFIGDAVNTAQRLESNCTPGRLLVCEELYRLGGGTFSSAERKELQVKNKKTPVVAYELAL